jgi:glycosyltransferase involved in cell wall biosynthesis
MRIALLHNTVLPPARYGGIERIVVSLVHQYRKLGHEVVLLCAKGSSMEGVETVVVPPDLALRPITSWLPKGIDFLHSHEPLRERPPIPFLITIHGNGSPEERYFPNTNFLSESHARTHGAKIFVYNGVDTERFPFVEKKEDYVVFLARASWRIKNLKTCIDFARDLKVKLVVMGGEGRNSEYVEYRGMIGEAEGKLDILARARALLYPTNWDEPCAVAPLESLACGTPVIASTNGCMPELVRPGTGFTCSTYPEFLSAWSKIESISPSACRESVLNHFSLERMAKDYLALMERIMKHGDLDHSPEYSFKKESVKPLYKPTWINRIRHRVLGKI